MSKILIENYRGFDIEFDTDCEKFQCICTEDNAKESTSFKSIKKFVDDYKKQNQEFKPFWIESNPNEYFSKETKLKVIGIRKDGRFVAENEKGEKIQISDWDSKQYMLFKNENINVMEEYRTHKELEEEQRVENNRIKKNILSKLKITTLNDFKNGLG